VNVLLFSGVKKSRLVCHFISFHRLLSVGACLVAGGNLADCSAVATSQNTDSALISINDDCSAAPGSQHSKTAKVTVCVNCKCCDCAQRGCD